MLNNMSLIYTTFMVGLVCGFFFIIVLVLLKDLIIRATKKSKKAKK